MTDTLDDPAAMTPSQRRHEIAAILARGVLRLRQCRESAHISQPSRTIKKASKTGQDGLELTPQTSPDGPAGLRPRDREELES